MRSNSALVADMNVSRRPLTLDFSQHNSHHRSSVKPDRPTALTRAAENLALPVALPGPAFRVIPAV